MECEHVREQFIERLTGTLDEERSQAIDAHIAGCAACRTETERMRNIWEELGSLQPRAATGGGAARIERLIDARGSAGALHVPKASAGAPSAPRSSVGRRAALLSAAIAASLLAGVVVGRRSVSPSDVATAVSAASVDAREQYLLLLEGPARTGPAGAPTASGSAAEAAIVDEYRAWAGRLQSTGALVSAEKLADRPITILAASGVIAPARNVAEEIGGFFLIQVADSAEAYRIARECPHLKYGGTVQVRRIEPT
jgi:hypothetical protein